MKLTPHFSLDELTRSDFALRNGIDNTPDQETIDNLRDLCFNILEPLRSEIYQPITILSGYRSHTLNLAIGGVWTSQHVQGRAADFIVDGFDNLAIIHTMVQMKLKFDQLINEFPPKGWVHVSYRKEGRGEVLEAYHEDGQTKYRTLSA